MPGINPRTGMPRSYDQWRTASPYDDEPTMCMCGHELDGHVDVTDHKQVAQRRQQALEALRNLRHAVPNKVHPTWTIDDWITYGLGACDERGCECQEPQEAELEFELD